MAINFPSSPSIGQVYEFGDYQYTFDGVKWTSVLKYGLAAAKVNSETAPESPEDGLMWYKPSTGKSYIWYEDQDSGQWVEENPSIGAVAHNLLEGTEDENVHPASSISTSSGWDLQDLLNRRELLDRSILVANGYSGKYGFFEFGFTYNSPGDLGIHSGENFYRYIGNGNFPVNVPTGTDPRNQPSLYEEVKFNDAGIIEYSNRSLYERLQDQKSIKDVPSIQTAVSTSGDWIIPEGPYTIDDEIVSESNTHLNGSGTATIVQSEDTKSVIRHLPTNPAKSNTSYKGINFVQPDNTPIGGGTDNNHTMLKFSGGLNNLSSFNTFEGQYGLSFGYGASDLTDRRHLFGKAIGNFAKKTKGMFIENIGASYTTILGNSGDGYGAGFHGIRLSGYKTPSDSISAECRGVVASSNAFRGFSRGVSAQNSASCWNISSQFVEDCEFGFQAIAGTSVDNNPKLGIISFTGYDLRKGITNLGGSHSEFQLVADASSATSTFIEELSSTGAEGHNSYSGILKDSSLTAVLLRYSHNRINLTIDGTLDGSGCVISGDYNTGSVIVDNADATGLSIFGSNNNICTTVTNCGGYELSVGGNDNVVKVQTSGDIIISGNNNLISGIVNGTVTDSGSGNDLSGIKGFSGKGVITGTSNGNGEIVSNIGRHESAPAYLVATVTNFNNNWNVRVKSIVGDVATFVVFDAIGDPVANQTVQVRWNY